MLKFTPEKFGKEIHIFKKDTITIFCKDKHINGPRISCDHHLKISIVENKVILENQNSINRTYLGKERILCAEIEDGYIINLAHVYKMTFHIYRGREIC